VIDMQAGDLGLRFIPALERLYPSLARYWVNRVDQTAVPNTVGLLDFFRRTHRTVVYTRNGKMTREGREMTPRLQLKEERAGFYHHRGMPEFDIDPRLAPREDELVIDKLTSGGFTASCLDHALRNMGISDLVISGILTDGCVLGTARVATELGYNVLICEDACATYSARAHVEGLLMHARLYGRVAQAQDVITELSL
jgi:ureidoacrylate peracid hydrolase